MGYSLLAIITTELDDKARRVDEWDELLVEKLNASSLDYRIMTNPKDSTEEKIYVRTDQIDDAKDMLNH